MGLGDGRGGGTSRENPGGLDSAQGLMTSPEPHFPLSRPTLSVHC